MADSVSQPLSERAVTTPPQPGPGIAALPLFALWRPPAPPPGLTVHKLSANENPFDPLPEVRRAIAGVTAWNRYPDLAPLALLDALADHLDVRSEQIAAGAGSLAVLNKVLGIYAGVDEDGTRSEVIYPWRSFEAYPTSLAAVGAVPVPVPLTGEGHLDLDAMIAAITPRTRVIIVCTPNNPIGPSLTQSALTDFVARVPDSILVVIDEAYREFDRNPDPVDGVAAVQGSANVLSLRTFSKAHGLAGLRVGYCVAHEDIAGNVVRVTEPFPVSRFAEVAAIASLGALPQVLARVEEVVAERERVTLELRGQGWAVPQSEANFIWLPMERAAEFGAAAMAEGLAIRTFPAFGGFSESGARVTIGNREANDRFVALCAQWSGR